MHKRLRPEEWYKEAGQFLQKAIPLLQSKKLLASNEEIDHLCYRTETLEEYNDLKKDLSKFCTQLVESIVNGRPIALFKLPRPIKVQNFWIDLIELPAPKALNPKKSGFEHLEIVTQRSFTSLMEEYSQYSWETRAYKNTWNPEIEISLGDFNVKFHHLSLEQVVNVEKKERVLAAIQNSRVLPLLNFFDPIVVGGFPLNLDRDHSDVDVLCHVKESGAFDFEKTCHTHFSIFPHYSFIPKTVDNKKVLLCRFEVHKVPFEIFASEQEVFTQRSYQLFIVESRILKLFGSNALREIQNLRHKGMKIEMAFTEYLKLAGDSQAELLKFFQLSEEELFTHAALRSLTRPSSSL